jgi:hypothetical protein
MDARVRGHDGHEIDYALVCSVDMERVNEPSLAS